MPILDINYFYCKDKKENFIAFKIGALPYLPTNNKTKIVLKNNKFEYEEKIYSLNLLDVIFEDDYVKIYQLVINDISYKVYINQYKSKKA